MPGGEITALHWRQAMQIAAQMPPEEEDAWSVLDCVEQILLLSFGGGPPATPSPSIAPNGQLLLFPSRPKRRAT